MKQLAACTVLLLAVATPSALAEDSKAAPSPFRIVINSDVTPVSHGEYRYPFTAARRGLDGTCEVEFVISQAGRADAIRIRSCSSDMFRGAAKQVIESMAFGASPAAKPNVTANIRWDIDAQRAS